MRKEEILQKWKCGLSKQTLANQYMREYNIKMKNIRLSVRHRHDGKMINSYEALNRIEKVIYNYLMNK